MKKTLPTLNFAQIKNYTSMVKIFRNILNMVVFYDVIGTINILLFIRNLNNVGKRDFCLLQWLNKSSQIFRVFETK